MSGQDRTALRIGSRYRIARLAGARRGSVALEFAILGPVLLFALMGMWDFSRALSEDSRVATAARVGVQYGVQSVAHSADSEAITRAARQAGADGGAELDVTPIRTCTCSDGTVVSCTGVCGVNGKPIVYLTVRVERDFNTSFTYPFVSNPITLSREARLRVQ